MPLDSTATYRPLLYEPDSVAPWPVEKPAKVEPAYCQDSLCTLWGGADSCERPSLFTGHSLHVGSNAAAVRNNTAPPDWVFFVVVAIVALVSLYLNRRKLKLTDLLAAAYTTRRLDRLERETGIKNFWGFVPMSLFYLVEVSLVALYISDNMAIDMPSRFAFLNYMLILLALVLFVLLRNGLTMLLGATYDCEQQASVYLTTSCIHHMLGTIVLLPVVSLLLYGTDSIERPMFIAALITIAATELLRSVRGVYQIFSRAGNRSLYLFYYLCILELVPVLVLLKLLSIL